MKLSRKLVLAALSALSLQQAALAAEAPGITPYRPSVSNSAQLPAAGQLELELGWLTAHSDAERRHSLPYLLKLGFSPEWGVLLGGEAAIADYDGAGNRVRGFGDTVLVLKRAFLIDEETAFGLEFGSKLPTAAQALGSGKTDYSVNGIYSRDLGRWHLDVNLNLNLSRLGVAEADSSRWQSGLSSSFSSAINDHWGFTAEWAGSRRAGTKAQGQALLALSYSPSKRLTLDAGFTRGLTSAAPDWSAFAGVVLPLARLW